MAGDHAEIRNALIQLQLFGEQARRILDEDRIRRVELRKGLLVLAFDHDLSFGGHSGPRTVDQVFKPEQLLALFQQN